MTYTVRNSDTPVIVNGWPVIVPTAQDGGTIRKDEILVDYEVISQSEVDEIIQDAARAGENDAVALLRRTVKGISGQVDEQKNPIPFNDDTFSAALNRTNQRGAMLNSLFDVLGGRKAARKN